MRVWACLCAREHTHRKDKVQSKQDLDMARCDVVRVIRVIRIIRVIRVLRG